MASRAPPLIGLLGANVGHSRLPRLFAAAWKHLEVRGALCVTLELDNISPIVNDQAGIAAGTAVAFDAVRAQSFTGLAVTMPCKEFAAAACDELSTAAKVIGAVNFVNVVRTEPGADVKLVGGNLDGWGAVQAFKESVPNFGTPSVLVLGAGGSSLAICQGLAELGARRLWLFDTDHAKARASAGILTAALAPLGTQVLACEDPLAALRDVTGVANCSPVGMHGGPIGMPLPPGALQRHTQVEWVFDVVCYPSWTPLLLEAKRLGRTPVPGMRMNDFIQRQMFIQLTGTSSALLPSDLFPSGMYVAPDAE